MRISDWSSDVCSSDLGNEFERLAVGEGEAQVGDGRRQHAARHEFQRELDEGPGGLAQTVSGSAGGSRKRVAYTTGMLPQTASPSAPAMQATGRHACRERMVYFCQTSVVCVAFTKK